jgi:hypothetical protein
MSDAMTDPRPRVTNRIGNAQQTSVVTALVSPTTALRRSRRISLLSLQANSTRATRIFRAADTPRLCSLNQQYGEQQVFWDGRNGQRDESAPFLERKRGNRDNDARYGREGCRARHDEAGARD